MEIRDPVHGSIHILDEEIPIIRDDFFQRLRNIKQLGFSEYVFPGATHTRFIHSIGVMNVADKAFDRLFELFFPFCGHVHLLDDQTLRTSKPNYAMVRAILAAASRSRRCG